MADEHLDPVQRQRSGRVMTSHWGFRRLLKLPRTRHEIARDVDDEIAFHLEARIEELRQQGLSPEDARAAALCEFGSVAAARRDLVSIDARRERSERRAAWWADLRHDLVHAVRALRRQPAFAAAILLVFTLGIGANTVVFSILHGVLLRPLPVAEPDRLFVATWGTRFPGATIGLGAGVSDTVVDAWRERTDLFESLGWHSPPYSPILSGLGDARHVTGWSVSPGFLDTLGVGPALGRTFSAEEIYPDSRVAIVSHAFWQRDLGGAPDVLDREITLDGVGVRIVGVMPRDMGFPVLPSYMEADATALWLPLPARRQSPGLGGSWTVVVRLRDGVSPEVATEALDALTPALDPAAARVVADRATQAGGRAGAALAPITESFLANMRRPLLVLMSAVALVLLIACANAGNLLLARGVARRREIAVRAALGAGRWRIVRLVLTETMLLACAGGALGVVAAHAVLPAVVAFAGHHLPRGETIRVDGVVLSLTVLACLVTGALAGLGPSLRASRDLRGDALRAAGVAAARGGWRRGTSGGFLVAQVALSLMLLACTGLLLRSLGGMVRAIGHGLDTGGVTVARLSLPQSYARDRLVSFATQMADEAQRRTGARRSAVSIGLPHDAMMLGGVLPEGAPAGTPPLRVATIPVTQGYFDVYGISLRQGRLLTDASPPDSAVISEAAARALFDGDAVGRRIVSGAQARTVIGVVSDVPGIGYEGGLKVVARPQEHIYIPFAAAPSRYYFTVSIAPGAGAAIPPASLRQAVREVDAGIAINGVYTLAEHVERKFAQADLYTRLLAALAIIALVIAAAGIYAVLAHGVAQRTPELGLRMALGARPAQVLRVVVSRALVLTSVGAVLGCGLAVAAARVIRANVFDVSAGDPLVLGGAIAGILLVALAAATVPALRALRVDPAEVLRAN